MTAAKGEMNSRHENIVPNNPDYDYDYDDDDYYYLLLLLLLLLLFLHPIASEPNNLDKNMH